MRRSQAHGEFDGREHGALSQSERDAAHLCVGLHARGKEGGQVGGAQRAEDGAKAAGFLDTVGGDPGGGELRQDQAAVLDDLSQPRLADQPCDLLGAEGALAGSAPDVDAARVYDQQPGIETVE